MPIIGDFTSRPSATGSGAGGAGAGARVQVGDITGAGVDEVIVNAGGSAYAAGDTLTFSSGTAEARVSVVNGGFAPETGSISINVELETGTITNIGIGGYLQLANAEKRNDGWYIKGEKLSASKTYKMALPQFVMGGGEANLEFLKNYQNQSQGLFHIRLIESG